jgi:hypothetical protein
MQVEGGGGTVNESFTVCKNETASASLLPVRGGWGCDFDKWDNPCK